MARIRCPECNRALSVLPRPNTRTPNYLHRCSDCYRLERTSCRVEPCARKLAVPSDRALRGDGGRAFQDVS